MTTGNAYAIKARRLAVRSFPCVAVVRRRVKANDGVGGRVQSVSEVEVGLAAKAYPKKAPVQVTEGQQPVSVFDFEMVCGDPTGERMPVDLDITAQDEVELDNNGILYRVVGSDKGRYGALMLTVSLVKVTK